MVPLCTRYRRHCTNFLVQRSRRSRRPPWPRPAARVHASSADSMAGPPTAVGTATEAVGGNWDVCSGPDRSSVWKRPWAPKAACAQSCRVRLPGRIETRPGSTHIRITQIRALVSGWTNDLRFRIPDSDLPRGRCSKERPVSGFRIPGTSWST